MSLRLQTVCLAIFDAILVHMLSELSPDGAWLALKKQLLSELVAKKETKQMGVLVSRHYRYSDVLCLQVCQIAPRACPTAAPECCSAALRPWLVWRFPR